MDIFDHAHAQKKNSHVPLADRMRPLDLSEFVGQETILGAGTLLRTSIEDDSLSSISPHTPYLNLMTSLN